MTPIFAHAGHWITSVIYAAPVVLLVGLLLLDNVRNRRRVRAEADGAGAPGGPEAAAAPAEHAPASAAGPEPSAHSRPTSP